eukprot:s1836_g15.t2
MLVPSPTPLPLPDARALAPGGHPNDAQRMQPASKSGQLLDERPPLPPPSLLDGFPDPQRVDARKQEYLKALQEQVRQRVATLTQRHQANLEYLRAKNDQCKRQARATIDQELLKQEMEVDRRHDEQLLALQQAAMRRKFNISKEAGALTLQYQTKATQEKLQHLDFELHRRYFDAAAKPDWTQAQVAAASPPLLPPPPGGFSSPLSVAGLEPVSPTSPTRKTPGTLFVSIQAGHNLMNRDTGILGDVSDPYVVVKLGRQEFTTPVINNDLNPVWHVDNKFTLQVDKESLNILSDDSLGRTSLDFRSLPANAWHSRRDLLKDGEKGELEYAVHFKPSS